MLGSDWSFKSLAPSRQMPLSDWSLLLPTLLLVKCCALIGRISIASALIGPFYHSTSAKAALWGFLSETQCGSWDKIQKSSLSVLESVPIRLGGLML